MGPRRHHTRSRLEKAPELLRARWVPELAQRLGLDLSDALAGDREVLPDLLQRVLATVGEAEAEPQHLLLARGERSEEHTSELQSRSELVCRLLLEKKKQMHVPDPVLHNAEFMPPVLLTVVQILQRYLYTAE